MKVLYRKCINKNLNLQQGINWVKQGGHLRLDSIAHRGEINLYEADELWMIGGRKSMIENLRSYGNRPVFQGLDLNDRMFRLALNMKVWRPEKQMIFEKTYTIVRIGLVPRFRNTSAYEVLDHTFIDENEVTPTVIADMLQRCFFAQPV